MESKAIDCNGSMVGRDSCKKVRLHRRVSKQELAIVAHEDVNVKKKLKVIHTCLLSKVPLKRNSVVNISRGKHLVCNALQTLI